MFYNIYAQQYNQILIFNQEPLKRIPVQKADLSKPFEKEIKTTCNKNQHVELSNEHPDNITKQKESTAICKPEENIESCREMPPIPTNAVQFLMNWKKHTSFDFRYRYLKVNNFLYI